MEKKLSQLVLCLAAAAATAPAIATEGSSWYIGAGAGQTTVRDWLSKGDALDALDVAGDELGVTSFSGTVAASSDDNDTATKIYGGYQIIPSLAIELSYIDLGEVTAKSSATGIFGFAGGGVGSGTVFTKITGETKAITVDGVGTAQVAPWLDLFARAGLYRAETELKVTVGASGAGGTATGSDSIDDDNYGMHFGVGANFNVIENVFIRAEWERLANVEIEEGEVNIDVLAISAGYRF